MRNSYVSTLCPVVTRPYLRTSDRWAGEPEDDARLVMTMHSIEIAPPHGIYYFYYHYYYY